MSLKLVIDPQSTGCRRSAERWSRPAPWNVQPSKLTVAIQRMWCVLRSWSVGSCSISITDRREISTGFQVSHRKKNYNKTKQKWNKMIVTIKNQTAPPYRALSSSTKYDRLSPNHPQEINKCQIPTQVPGQSTRPTDKWGWDYVYLRWAFYGDDVLLVICPVLQVDCRPVLILY